MVEFIGVYKFNLRNINLRIEKGEFLVVHGKGGAGKTTLLKLAYGELTPDQGRVKIFNNNTLEVTHSIKKKIGYIQQQGGVLEDKDVWSNIEIPLKLLGEYSKNRVLSIFHRLGLYEYHTLKACELSSSYRQLLKITLQLAKNPLLVVADEPLQNLDPEQAETVLSTFRDMNATGVTILFATSQSIPKGCTREIYIRNGELYW